MLTCIVRKNSGINRPRTWPLLRRVVFVLIVITSGCTQVQDQSLVATPTPTPPPAAEPDPLPPPPVIPAVGVWAPIVASHNVCAWRGASFSPDDFYRATDPREFPSSQCLNFAMCGWEIQDPSAPRISIAEARRPVELPFELPPPPPKPGTRGRRHTLKVDDGWLIGFNAGEWGGSVWWASPDGSELRVLDDDVHILDFFELGGRIWAPSEYIKGHSEIHVLELVRDSTGAWQIRRGPELRAGADAAVVAGERLLIASIAGVDQMSADGRLTTLFEVDWFVDHPRVPRSILRAEDGTIYIGMNHAVVRLEQSPDGYVEQWLIPPACRAVVIADDFPCCTCAGLLAAPGTACH